MHGADVIAFFFNGYATNDYVEAAIQIARKHRTSRRENSRIFALLTIAMHDTSVTVFRAKRDFGMNPVDITWRPILAILHFRGSSHATAMVAAQIADYVLKNAAQPIRRR